MPVSSLCHHMYRAHRIIVPQNQGEDIGGGVPETFLVSSSRVLKLVTCPVYRCSARAHNPERLSKNLMYWNWKSNVDILQ